MKSSFFFGIYSRKNLKIQHEMSHISSASGAQQAFSALIYLMKEENSGFQYAVILQCLDDGQSTKEQFNASDSSSCGSFKIKTLKLKAECLDYDARELLGHTKLSEYQKRSIKV
jgi:hypothetical protein